jgi:cysteinyl-tRNA synthetase
MSKSLGNFLVIREILKEYHPEAIRLFLLSNHYRSPIDFTHQAMVEAESGLEKIYALLERIDEVLGSSDPEDGEPSQGNVWADFCEVMNDDFNTARGIGVVFETVRELNRTMDSMNGTGAEKDVAGLVSARADLMHIGSVLGILTEAPPEFFAQRQSVLLKRKGIDTALVERLIAERVRAREEKDWARADQIRDELSAMDVLIEDRPEGTIWKVK